MLGRVAKYCPVCKRKVVLKNTATGVTFWPGLLAASAIAGGVNGFIIVNVANRFLVFFLMLICTATIFFLIPTRVKTPGPGKCPTCDYEFEKAD